MASPNTPHDAFFRKSLEHPQVISGYLESYLPSDVAALFNLDTLEFQKETFVDDELHSHPSDVLYKTKLVSGDEAYIYILLEHKSHVDKLVALQLLRYMVRLWERQRQVQEPLTPILPIVIYHGARTWRVPTDFATTMDIPDALQPYFPNFNYHLTNVSYRSLEEIRGNIWTQAFLLTLRDIFDPAVTDNIDASATKWFLLKNEEGGVVFIRRIVYYHTEVNEYLSHKDLIDVLRQQGRKGEEVMTTIAQKLRQEGKEIGFGEGKQVGFGEGIGAGIRNSIITVLEARFDTVPATIRQQLNTITNTKTLKQLLTQATKAETMADFNQQLRP